VSRSRVGAVLLKTGGAAERAATTPRAARPSRARRATAEGVGTALLLAAVVGSGIMAERLAGGNVGLALLANALATGAALFVLIAIFGPVSGAHFNPLVTLAAGWEARLDRRDVFAYLTAQLGGAVAGVWLAHLMFDLPLLQVSLRARSGIGQWTGEFVATFGLVAVIEGGRRMSPTALAAAIAAYIGAAYWFTSSTSFANPAVTIARSLTDSFAGIAPADAPGFILAQCIGGLAAVGFSRWIFRAETGTSS
jgi:glycerol uptake facilitator-like aquaporin